MEKFCTNCGKEINEGADVCLGCGKSLGSATPVTSDGSPAKSKIAGGILGIFFGYLGVHNFYLGYTGKAVAQLLLFILGIPLMILIIGFFMISAASLWGFIEGILILTGSINKDAKGNPLAN